MPIACEPQGEVHAKPKNRKQFIYEFRKMLNIQKIKRKVSAKKTSRMQSSKLVGENEDNFSKN